MIEIHQRKISAWILLAAGIGLFGAGCKKSTEPIVAKDPEAIAAATTIAAADADWPWWLGPSRDNHAEGEVPPLEWDQDTNVLWKATVPGRGHSTPIVCGDAVYVTTAEKTKQTKSLLCLDRESGEKRWETPIHQTAFMHAHQKNSQASATPACDGEQIYTVFMVDNGIWATAVDLQGKIVWQKQAGNFVSKHGYGSSPLVYRSLLIVAGDSSGGGFLTALYRESGEVAWRTPRDSDSSFGTPTLLEIDGKQQIVLSGHQKVVGYDPHTGEELWSSEGPASTTANTPVAWNGMVFASGGYPEQNLFAIKPTGNEVAWRHKVKVYVPSLLVIGDRLLAISDNGVARLYDASSGEMVWQERLGGEFSSSPVLCGDYVFATTEHGLTHVFKPGDKLETVAENQLGKAGFATPVICGGRLYLRTEDALYCIGK